MLEFIVPLGRFANWTQIVSAQKCLEVKWKALMNVLRFGDIIPHAEKEERSLYALTFWIRTGIKHTQQRS